MYEYKTKYGKWKTKWTKYKNAGGQKKEGTHFANGKGGFHWSDSCGPKVSVSFSYSAPFAPFSVGVSVGKSSDSIGKWVPITDKKKYVKKHMYKLQIRKRIKARAYTFYRRRRYAHGKKGKWKVRSRGNEYIVLADGLRAKAVGKCKK